MPSLGNAEDVAPQRQSHVGGKYEHQKQRTLAMPQPDPADSPPDEALNWFPPVYRATGNPRKRSNRAPAECRSAEAADSSYAKRAQRSRESLELKDPFDAKPY